ncbi:MAG TPA: response regulator [bacterium]|nr:response regulator [bacterium]HPN30646.1 response regulator [bacterium]
MPNLLLIDDSPTMRKMIKLALKSLNLTIFESNNGIEGIEILNNEKIDIAMTDLNMPEMNGFDFLRYMRQNENYSNTPVIIVSTENKLEILEEAKKLGITEYLKKPFNMKELQELIAKLLTLNKTV